MPAYNFSPEFANDVQHRRKRSTIRMSDKNAKVGDTVYLYTGQRTKQCRSLGTSTLVALETISLHEKHVIFGGFTIRANSLLDLLARADGFKDYPDMTAWFKSKYKIDSLDTAPIRGYLHAWS